MASKKKGFEKEIKNNSSLSLLHISKTFVKFFHKKVENIEKAKQQVQKVSILLERPRKLEKRETLLIIF